MVVVVAEHDAVVVGMGCSATELMAVLVADRNQAEGSYVAAASLPTRASRSSQRYYENCFDLDFVVDGEYKKEHSYKSCSAAGAATVMVVH